MTTKAHKLFQQLTEIGWPDRPISVKPSTRQNAYQIVGIPLTEEQVKNLLKGGRNGDLDDDIAAFNKSEGIFCQIYCQPCCYQHDQAVPVKYIFGVIIKELKNMWDLCACMGLFEFGDISEADIVERIRSVDYVIPDNCEPIIGGLLKKEPNLWTHYLLKRHKNQIESMKLFMSMLSASDIYKNFCEEPSADIVVNIYTSAKKYGLPLKYVNILMSDDCYYCS